MVKADLFDFGTVQHTSGDHSIAAVQRLPYQRGNRLPRRHRLALQRFNETDSVGHRPILAYLPFAYELRNGDLDSNDCGHHLFDEVSRRVGHCPRRIPLSFMFARQRFYV
jgi:hypothetical protein